MKRLLEEMKYLHEAGEDLVLVTVIAGSGSTPRGAGARMVVRSDGSTTGTIGGGAVEYQAGQLAYEALKEKKSCTKGFKLAKNQVADLGMICGGDVVVYFQYISKDAPAFSAFCEAGFTALSKNEDSWIITDITDETAWSMGIFSLSTGIIGMDLEGAEMLCLGKPAKIESEGKKYYSEPLVKSGRVYIFGGGHVAQELVPVLAHLDFRCVVFDDREIFANKEVFPDAEDTVVGDFEHITDFVTIGKNDYLCIMTRGHQYDYLIQKQALLTPACYIGVMGSRNKLRTLDGKLLEEGFTKEDIARFQGPIGTPILAETPAEIAISIAGELIKTRAGIK